MTAFTLPAGVPAIEFIGVEKRFPPRGSSGEVLAKPSAGTVRAAVYGGAST